jgi:hypothetical protein
MPMNGKHLEPFMAAMDQANPASGQSSGEIHLEAWPTSSTTSPY